jgi:hypothetical protein
MLWQLAFKPSSIYTKLASADKVYIFIFIKQSDFHNCLKSDKKFVFYHPQT